MLRKMLAMFLVITMIVSLAACAGNLNKDEDTNVSTSNLNDVTVNGDSETTVTNGSTVQTGNDENEMVDETKKDVIVTDTEDTITTATTPNGLTAVATTTAKGEQGSTTTTGKHTHKYGVSNTVKANCTTDGSKTYICSCGSSYSETLDKIGHNFSSWKSDGNGKMSRTCSNCNKIEYKDATTAANTNGAVCKSFKLIRVERADTESTVDGVHVLDYLLGKNKYFQQGDTLVYEFDFEKGSLADYVVEKQQNADVSVSGNLLKIKIVKNWTIVHDSYLRVWLKDKHENRLVVIDFMQNEIFWYDGRLMNETEAMSHMFHIYAAEKHNIEFVSKKAKDDEDKQYTEFMPSITGRPEGYDCDDLFYKNDVDNWVKYLQWLLCEYEKMGIVSWHCQVRGKHVVTVARVA